MSWMVARWAALRALSSAHPKEVFLVMGSLIMIVIVAGIFLVGLYIGRQMMIDQYELDASRTRQLHLQAETALRREMLQLQARHRTENEKLFKELLAQERRTDAIIRQVLIDNPEVARWYYAPINEVERAVMYGTGSDLLQYDKNRHRAARHPH